MSLTISPHQNVNSAVTGTSGYVFNTAGGIGGSITAATTWANPNPSVLIEQSGVVELRGAKADLVVNGVSLNDTLQSIQDRLNILRPNVELESEWDELRELGEQYRKKEAEFLEKKRAWDILKKQEG